MCSDKYSKPYEPVTDFILGSFGDFLNNYSVRHSIGNVFVSIICKCNLNNLIIWTMLTNHVAIAILSEKIQFTKYGYQHYECISSDPFLHYI